MKVQRQRPHLCGDGVDHPLLVTIAILEQIGVIGQGRRLVVVSEAMASGVGKLGANCYDHGGGCPLLEGLVDEDARDLLKVLGPTLIS